MDPKTQDQGPGVVCPACGTPLTEQMMCPNVECPEKDQQVGDDE